MEYKNKTTGRYNFNEINEKEEIKKSVKKIFLSHKMNGLSDVEIRIRRKDMELRFKNKFPDISFEIIDNVNHEPNQLDESRLWHLGASIQQMADADYVIFDSDYKDARGCRVEECVAINYNLVRIYL